MSKTRILIVDDDMAASRLLGMGLEKTGAFQVKVENSATQALARTREFRPDLILLDEPLSGLDVNAAMCVCPARTAVTSPFRFTMNRPCARHRLFSLPRWFPDKNRVPRLCSAAVMNSFPNPPALPGSWNA